VADARALMPGDFAQVRHGFAAGHVGHATVAVREQRPREEICHD